MPNINEFVDPLLIEWNQSVVEINEPLVVINRKVTLTQIPSKLQRVNIVGYGETQNEIPSIGQYYVNYQNGQVTFFTNVNDGVSINSHYYGRGVIYYPASRIYSSDSNGSVVETIGSIIKTGRIVIDNIEVITTLVEDSVTATENANLATTTMNSLITEVDSSEGIRVSKEIGRVNAELIRKTNEDERLVSENNRITQELARVENEESRIDSEEARNYNEDTREAHELLRESINSANNYFDDYNALHSYVPLNKTYYLGSTYRCILETVGHTPTNTTYWTPMALKGLDGDGSGGGEGTVTSVESANEDITIENETTNLLITLNSGTSGANKVLKLDELGHLSADLLVDGITNKVYTTTEKTLLHTLDSNNSRVQATGTISSLTEQTVLTYVAGALAAFNVYGYFKISNATTSVTYTITYTSIWGTTTFTVLSSQSMPIGEYSALPFFINAVSGTQIIIKITASIINNVQFHNVIRGV